jgi:hypothetical protein
MTERFVVRTPHLNGVFARPARRFLSIFLLFCKRPLIMNGQALLIRALLRAGGRFAGFFLKFLLAQVSGNADRPHSLGSSDLTLSIEHIRMPLAALVVVGDLSVHFAQFLDLFGRDLLIALVLDFEH